MENLLSRISYDGIVEGNYKEEEIRATARAQALGFSSYLKSASRSSPAKRYSKEYLDETRSMDALSSPTRGGESFSFGDHELFVGSLSVSKEPKSDEPRTKTREINFLEKLLSLEYKNPNLEITRVEALPKSRKEVKRVYFVIGNDMYQVWLYKADPKETTRELNICKIIYEKGIPTAKPIGYIPKLGEDYPYEVAVLGGVVENAGESYDELIKNLQLAPDRIFDTAKGISRLLAFFHNKLTFAKEVFEETGIHLDRLSPRREILERLVSGIKIKPDEAEELINGCVDLYNKQAGRLVVSHGDIHTGNIVTKETPNHNFGGQMRTSLTDFGIIDFGSLCLDYPEGDLVDFWIHHQRKAQDVSPGYNFDIDDIKNEYGEGLNSQNIAIQQALWNIYEMFDPTRKSDRGEKSKYHYDAFVKSGEVLKALGLGKDFNKVKRELDKIRKSHPNETFSLFK